MTVYYVTTIENREQITRPYCSFKCRLAAISYASRNPGSLVASASYSAEAPELDETCFTCSRPIPAASESSFDPSTWAWIMMVTMSGGVAGYLVRYLIASSRVLGKIDQAFTDHGNRLDRIESWQDARDAEAVAYRNGYRPRPRR
jgi:hypothetical protein